jgi:hypothetical protein
MHAPTDRDGLGRRTIGMKSKLAAQFSFAIAGLVPVSAGLWCVLVPADTSVSSLLSHGRYLSGLLLAIGLAFWSTIPTLERQTARVRLLAAVVIFGGLCRLLGVVLGDPLSLPVAGALVMELVVMPLLTLWQSRLVAR